MALSTRIRCAAALASALLGACAGPPEPPRPIPEPVVWKLDSLDAVGGWPAESLGSPDVIHDADGAAVAFDGVDDGLQVAHHPLAGAREFTAEVVFRPDRDGPDEQRFLHLQERGSKDRILFETRMVGGDRWFLDTYVKSGGEGYTLYAKRFVHPAGRWYHAALVVTQGEMRHYVDGELEMSREIEFEPQGPGRTSIGVRINRVSWFKGAIREARFTPRALKPEAFSGASLQRGSID